MLWLINQATAGDLTTGQVAVQEAAEAKTKQPIPASKAGETSFVDIKIDMTT
jgi:hypothetical protein